MISIIIPFYNSERFLEECLESLVNQTRKDFAVFLVDDGSKDSSADIAKQYVAKYPHMFTYMYQDNQGQGVARNTGFAFVKTPFTMFLDSDDFYGPRMIENVYKGIERDKDFDIAITTPALLDMTTLNYWIWFDDKLVADIFKDTNVTCCKEKPEVLSLEANMCRCVWKTSFLKENNFKFQEKVKWEDVEPHFVLFYKAKKIVNFDFSGGYYYRVNSGGQTTSLAGKERLDMLTIYNQIVDFAEKENWNTQEYAHLIRMMNAYLIWTINVISPEFRKEYIDGFQKILKRLPLKYFRAYSHLREPYQHYRKRYLIVRCARSKVFKGLLINAKYLAALQKVWKILTGKKDGLN